MAEQPMKAPLKKPPGYRDSSAPVGPARRPTIPASFRKSGRRRRRRSGCRICCCFLVVFSLLLSLAGAIAAGIFYLWFDPKFPTFHLQSLSFSRFNLTTKPDDGTYLDAAAVARVEAKNPNGKLEVYYGPSQVELVATGLGIGLGSDDMAGFGLGRANATSLRVETAVKGLLVEDELVKRLKSGFKTKGLLVGVRIRTRVGYVVQGIRIWSIGVRVVCGGVSLKRLHAGHSPKCTLVFLKWIKIR